MTALRLRFRRTRRAGALPDGGNTDAAVHGSATATPPSRASSATARPMTVHLTTEQVWREIKQQVFAVLGMVTPEGEARTVGIVYAVADAKLYIATQTAAWKTRHIASNPHVSLTVPIAKRIPFLPWFKIPAATITFAGMARVRANHEIAPALLHRLYRGVVKDAAALAASCVIEVVPEKEFVTYGVGIPLLQMRFPDRAGGRVAVLAP